MTYPWLARWPDKSLHGNENLRICSLPFVQLDPDLDLTETLRRPGGTMRLLSVQSQNLYTLQQENGLVAFAGTGSGKTYTALLAGSVVADVDRVLIVAPSSTLKNLSTERMELRKHFYLHSDIQFHSYEACQRATPEGKLDYLEEQILLSNNDPNRTLLVFDEAQNIRNLGAARTMRVMRIMFKYPGLRVACLSGSMTDKSVRDYLHLSWMALRDKSPVPSPWLWPLPPDFNPHAPKTAEVIWHNNAADAAMAWSAVIDKDGEAVGTDWEDFLPIWQWAFGYESAHPATFQTNTERRALAQRALNYRLRTAPGVVLTRATSLEDTPLIIHGISDLEIPEELKDAISQIREGVDPDGNPLPDFSATWRAVRQLAQGFYYKWDWPVNTTTGQPIKDHEWLNARSMWNKLVRKEIINNAETGYDSALLVYNYVYRQVRRRHARGPLHEAWLEFIARGHKDEYPGKVSVFEREALQQWIAAGGDEEKFEQCLQHFRRATEDNGLEHAWIVWSAKQKHKQQPPTKAVWMSSFFIDRVMTFIKEQEAEGFPPLVWYEQKAVGEELGRRGVRVYGAGTNPNPNNSKDPAFAFTCALATKTHSEGKNLQPWRRNLILCPRPSGTTNEQMLARTHRTHQIADRVDAWYMQHIRDFREALAAARAAADYVQSSTDNEQKLIRAVLDNIKLPKLGSERVQQLASIEETEDGDE